MVLSCVDAVLEKKLKFDLKTPSPESGEVGEGGRRGESQQFFCHVRASHTLLCKESMLGFVENCIFFNSFVMFYDSVTK